MIPDLDPLPALPVDHLLDHFLRSFRQIDERIDIHTEATEQNRDNATQLKRLCEHPCHVGKREEEDIFHREELFVGEIEVLEH